MIIAALLIITIFYLLMAVSFNHLKSYIQLVKVYTKSEGEEEEDASKNNNKKLIIFGIFQIVGFVIIVLYNITLIVLMLSYFLPFLKNSYNFLFSLTNIFYYSFISMNGFVYLIFLYLFLFNEDLLNRLKQIILCKICTKTETQRESMIYTELLNDNGKNEIRN